MHSRSHSRRSIFASLIAGTLALAGLVTGPASAQSCSPDQVAKLLATDGAESDFFGSSVSISGDTAVIGANNYDNNGTRSGSAYVYRYDGANWVQEAKLFPADGASWDAFGYSVSISGDTAIIGSYEDDNGNGSNAGSAYIFTRSGSEWTQQAKLLVTDGGANERFGASVAIDGNTAFIGTTHSGRTSAYIFTRSGNLWTQRAELLPNDVEAGDSFGVSVSINGDTAAIGAYRDDDNGSRSGSAYIYRFNGTSWTQEAKLLPADGAASDEFGVSVSVSGDTAIVGAWTDDDYGNDTGAAYIFTRSGNTWSQQDKFLPPDGVPGGRFGLSVSIDSDTAVVGEYFDFEFGPGSGSAHVFTRSDGAWSHQSRFLPADGADNDQFGVSVAVANNTALIGAHRDDDSGYHSGSAYIFDLNCTAPCLADVNNDGSVTPADFTAWIAAFNAGDPECDQNGDGACTPADFTAWIANFNAGCP